METRCKKCGELSGVYGPESKWFFQSYEGIFMPVACVQCGYEWLIYFEYVEELHPPYPEHIQSEYEAR